MSGMLMFVPGAMTPAAFDDLQQVTGLNYNPHGVLASSMFDGRFDVVGLITYDWVHSLLQGGAFVVEAGLVIEARGPICHTSNPLVQVLNAIGMVGTTRAQTLDVVPGST